MDIKQYYMDLQTALNNVELMIVQAEAKVTDEYDAVDYSTALKTLYELMRNIKRMLVIHKTQGFSKTEFINANVVENNGMIVIEHVVKKWETITNIARLYNADVAEILTINSLISDDLVPGTVLNVKVSNTIIIDEKQNNTVNVPVYGSRVGENIYGYDWPDEFAADTKGGDIKILKPLGTLRQGITNRLSTKNGDYPMEDDFGISLVGSEYPKELRDGLLTIEASQQLEQDARIESIESITVTSEANNTSFEAVVNAIKGKESITVLM